MRSLRYRRGRALNSGKRGNESSYEFRDIRAGFGGARSKEGTCFWDVDGKPSTPAQTN